MDVTQCMYWWERKMHRDAKFNCNLYILPYNLIKSTSSSSSSFKESQYSNHCHVQITRIFLFLYKIYRPKENTQSNVKWKMRSNKIKWVKQNIRKFYTLSWWSLCIKSASKIVLLIIFSTDNHFYKIDWTCASISMR